MLVVDSSFTGLTERSSEMSSPMLNSVGTAVETPVVMPGGATGMIAVDPAAASSIAAAPSLRTAMIISELPVGFPAESVADMMYWFLPANRVATRLT